MPDWTRPGQRWRLVVPAGAVVVDAEAADPAADRRGPAGRRDRRAQPAPAAGSARAPGPPGLRVDAEYLVLPSLAEAVVLAPLATLPWTARAVLTVPPGVTRLHPVYSVAIAAVRAVPGLLRLPGPRPRRRREAAVTGPARPPRSRPPSGLDGTLADLLAGTARAPCCSAPATPTPS